MRPASTAPAQQPASQALSMRSLPERGPPVRELARLSQLLRGTKEKPRAISLRLSEAVARRACKGYEELEVTLSEVDWGRGLDPELGYVADEYAARLSDGPAALEAPRAGKGSEDSSRSPTVSPAEEEPRAPKSKACRC